MPKSCRDITTFNVPCQVDSWNPLRPGRFTATRFDFSTRAFSILTVSIYDNFICLQEKKLMINKDIFIYSLQFKV